MQVTDELVRAGALALNARTGGNEARFKHMQEVYMAEARAAITAALAAMWQPIETAPKDGSNILLGCATYVDAAYWDEDGWTLYPVDDTQADSTHCMRFRPTPTHWMPLPAEPEHSVAERNDVKEKGFVHILAESK